MPSGQVSSSTPSPRRSPVAVAGLPLWPTRRTWWLCTDHWRETVWKSRAILNDLRRTCIAARLAEGLTVADLKRAADGATRDDWLMGRAEGVRSVATATGDRVPRRRAGRAPDAASPRHLAPSHRPPLPVLRQPHRCPCTCCPRRPDARAHLADPLERGFSAPSRPA